MAGPYTIDSATDYNLRAQIVAALNDLQTQIDPMLRWTWPSTDGAPGSTLNTDGNWGLYWIPPSNPPDVVDDDDQTDVVIAVAPAWTVAPVSVTATLPSAPAHVTFSCTMDSTSNNRTVYMRMLVDGVPTGAVYGTLLQRNEETFVRHVWEVDTPNQNEVITVELQADGTGCNLLGTVTNTNLLLIQPTGVALSANYAGIEYIITPAQFWSRWSNTALENLAKLLNRQNIMGGPPSWLNVARAQIFVSFYSAQNINLLDQQTIDNINELVTLSVLTPAEAATILAT